MPREQSGQFGKPRPEDRGVEVGDRLEPLGEGGLDRFLSSSRGEAEAKLLVGPLEDFRDRHIGSGLRFDLVIDRPERPEELPGRVVVGDFRPSRLADSVEESDCDRAVDGVLPRSARTSSIHPASERAEAMAWSLFPNGRAERAAWNSLIRRSNCSRRGFASCGFAASIPSPTSAMGQLGAGGRPGTPGNPRVCRQFGRFTSWWQA